MLSRIGQIAVTVGEVERATAFYRDVLGLKFLFAAPGLAFFDAGGTWLMLSRPEQAEFDHPASILYFDVEDIKAAHAALASRGVQFRTEPHPVHRDGGRALWLADFYDGEGNTFCLRAWVAA